MLRELRGRFAQTTIGSLIAVLVLATAAPVFPAGWEPGAEVDQEQDVKVRQLPPDWDKSELDRYAVVDTDIEPEDAQLYLDGRFIGTADDFDGYPDFLFLEPGFYRLECRHDRFTPRTIELEAEAGYRYNIDTEMRKARCKRRPEERCDRGELQRHYAPCDRSDCPDDAEQR